MSVALYEFYCTCILTNMYMYCAVHVYTAHVHVIAIQICNLCTHHTPHATHTPLQEQTHTDRRESIRLKEELQVYKTRTERLSKLQSAMRSQEHKLEDVDAAMKKITV